MEELSNGDIAAQKWAEECYAEELERLAKFVVKTEVDTNDRIDG